MLQAAGREVVSKTSAYNITKLSYRVEVRVNSGPSAYESELLGREQIIGSQMCHDSFFDE